MKTFNADTGEFTHYATDSADMLRQFGEMLGAYNSVDVLDMMWDLLYEHIEYDEDSERLTYTDTDGDGSKWAAALKTVLETEAE